MKRLRVIRNVRLGVKNLMLHKLRSLLTVLGLVFGVSSVIAMLSVGEGASQAALDQIRKLGSNNIILSSVKPSTENEVQQEGRMSMYGLLHKDDMRIRETMPSVEQTVPVKTTRKTGRLGNQSLDLRVVGTTDEWFQLVKRRIIAGREIEAEDVAKAANVVVLTEHGGRKLLATRNSIGQAIQIGGDAFRVVGIVRSEPGGEHSPDMEADAYIPITTSRERFGDIETRREQGSRSRELVELHKILVQVDDIHHVEPTADAIRAMLRRFHKKEDYHMYVPLALLRQAEATKRTFNIVLGSIAGISLLVGGIGIMNIMLASVTERTREIGIRRAIGARRRQIVGQFLIETIVLSTVGGVIGICLGVIFPKLVTHFSDMPTLVPTYSIILSLGISMGVGIVFGIYPAIRASMLDPIVALRHE
jgi:putative ABC transport system permease protein